MNYGYVRVSSINQNVDRQLEELHKFGLTDKQIFIDKQSGEDFNRTAYQKLIKKLKSNDLLVIKSIDRLGRNYQMIIDEWSRITKTIGADVVVLDMPLLDTRTKPENLVGKFISDVVLQVLSFVAQNEREAIRQRQAEGIAIAKAKGIHMGRPRLPIPDIFPQIAKKYLDHEITNAEASRILSMSKGTFFRNLKIFKLSIGVRSCNTLN